MLPFDLDFLNHVHDSWLGFGKSAVDTSSQVLIGRPFGGTAILFKKEFSGCIRVVETFDDRLTAVKLDSTIGPILLVCVYMPCDTGDTDCYQNFTDICCKISALYSDVDAVHAVVGGDFNCQQGTRFFNMLTGCANDNKFVIADTQRLCNVFTYCSDDGLRQSWIDHLLCSSVLDCRILSVCTLPQFVSSDHKPFLITFNDLNVNTTVCSPVTQKNCCRTSTADWSKADDYSLLRYETVLNDLLSQVNIPVSLLASDYANASNNQIKQ